MRHRADLRQRLKHADLVVRGHHATSTVVSVTAPRSASRSTRPSSSTGETGDAPAVGFEPLARVEHGLVLDGGPYGVVARRGAGLRAPLIARLFDSVAPLVKVDLAGASRRGARPLPRALRHRLLRSQPERVMPAGRGFPNTSVKYGSIASTTRGSTGVVE